MKSRLKHGMRKGIMKQDVHLLGTSLKLKRGDKVILHPATNQPQPEGKWFARPPRGVWRDGIKRDKCDSILVTEEDVKVL